MVSVPLESLPVSVLVALPFVSLIVTLPVAAASPLGVAIVILYLPAFLLVGGFAMAPLSLPALTSVAFCGVAGGEPGAAGAEICTTTGAAGAGLTVREPVSVKAASWSSPSPRPA